MSSILSAVAWPYANGPRHIGHVAGFGVPSDIFSRYMRMAGHDVLMVSGTDEHGTPILVAADATGVTPRALADALGKGGFEAVVRKRVDDYASSACGHVDSRAFGTLSPRLPTTAHRAF